MGAKKVAAKPKMQRVGEAVVKYEAGSASPVRPLGEMLWLAFQQLSDDDQRLFLGKVLEDPRWREDLFDSIIVKERRGGPTRPYEEFRAEMVRDGLL